MCYCYYFLKTKSINKELEEHQAYKGTATKNKRSSVSQCHNNVHVFYMWNFFDGSCFHKLQVIK